MGKVYSLLSADLTAWIKRQAVFFVATAPLSARGHVNVSPKGGDALRILGPLEVAYQDYTGSGAETAAHVRENGRIVLMFCAFDGPPKIVRLHGHGTLVARGHERFEAIAAHFPTNPGTRGFVHVLISRVSDSCGFAVPTYELKGGRDTLDRWAINKGPEGLERYRREKNQKSIDGLSAFDVPHEKPRPDPDT
jgi:hypothetical protein